MTHPMGEVSPRTRAHDAARIPHASTAGDGSCERWWSYETAALLCRGRGCHTVYDARDVIDPENEDYALYVPGG